MTNEFSQNDFEWLIIFIIYNNKELDKDKTKEQEFRTIEFHKKYVFDILKNLDHTDRIKIVAAEAQVEKEGNNLHTNLFLYELDSVNKKIKQITPNRQVRLNSGLQHQISLESILSQFYNTYNANRHIIVTIGHGSILGVNFTNIKMSEQPSQKTKEQKQLINEEIIRVNKDFVSPDFDNSWYKESYNINDQISGLDKNINSNNLYNLELKNSKLFQEIITSSGNILNILTNREMNESFQNVFKTKKVDFLIMHNCIMQTVFTQYELRNTVDFLIAPESGITHPGYNYEFVLKELILNPHLDNNTIAKKIIDSMDKGANVELYKDDIATWSINAIQLDIKLYDELKIYFDEICNELLFNKNINHYNLLQSCNRSLFNYGRYCLNDNQIIIIDFSLFITELHEQLSRYFKDVSFDKTILIKTENVLKSIKNYPYRNKKFYTFYRENDPDYFIDRIKDNKTPTGFGILMVRGKTSSDLLYILLNVIPNEITPSIVKLSNKYIDLLNFIINKK